MASATPDLRLPSQPQGIAAYRLVPHYTASWQRHMCANNLPKVVVRESARPVMEPATSESQVQRPNHYITQSHLKTRIFRIRV